MEPNILECILDGRLKPTDLPLGLLENITANFSEDRLIGYGGFGAVYKGVLPKGNVVVKRIENNLIEEKVFRREIGSLLNTSHQNIERILGFCATTEHKVIEAEVSGDYIYAEMRKRLLCFEYMSNGSLQKYITDELRGLEWNTRYQIIRGICEGLHYLHKEKSICHLDLKPTNILLDNHMVPKIKNFGLSRLDVTRTMVIGHFGSLGYCAPEYLDHGMVSFKSDMFSLGIIITELVTGVKGIPDSINKVLRRWRHRWNKSGNETPLAYQQVAKCMEIGLLCREIDPSKRPSISDLIHDIREMEGVDGTISTAYEYTSEELSPYSDDQMLGIEPLELHFPFELNKHILCSFELTNKRGAYIAFNIRNTSSLKFFIEPNKGIMPPQSKCSVEIVLRAQEKAPQYMQQAYAFILQSTKVEDGLEAEDITAYMFKETLHNVVDEVNLDVVFDAKELQSELLDAHKLEISCPFELNNKIPIVLTLEHLKTITDNFSTKLELGRGGYGVVYKGVYPRGGIVAVKKLFAIHLVKDDQFRDEVSHLTGIKHRNVVQTLGYCAETSYDLIPQPTGRPIWAETPKRLICFEYVPNKSLDKYISDECLGLEWNLRYEIIKGICQGLHFLHEECHMVHLDLKPENILMDAAMVPKIADFGLSKIFGDQQSRLIIPDKSRAGSAGYMAPEYVLHGIASIRADIFSLGVIIIQIVTGHKEYPLSSAYFKLFNDNHCPQSTETSFQDYTERVVGSWGKKFASTPKYKAMEKYTKQVKQCIDIALNCVDTDVSNRPTAKDIIRVLIGVDQNVHSDDEQLRR
ncbi:unnamed protein product [Triticum turgidum subsp. durum]|uniref:Protein kinase domain-containing protein n=1 Tax=Triticum turgidum subsp. durum TaxID=4567 RepID=A0A9R0SS82_TRITD|nr:unnamed protein product [Triticum turgidum subsp. durum]